MKKFKSNISTKEIADLRYLISKGRTVDWGSYSYNDAGISFKSLSLILDYWENKFSWKEEEKKLNKFEQYIFNEGNCKTHFLHIKSHKKNAIPLLLIHGWPGSVFEFFDVIPLLTNPEANNFLNYQHFDLIIPSLPNVGFSFDKNQYPLGLDEISNHFIKLMDSLGYDKYFIQGGDLGSFIASIMSVKVPTKIKGIHLNMIPLPRGLDKKPNNPKEKKYYKELKNFLHYEAGYQYLQGTKPFTLAHALNSSPVSLCAYISEKFYSWTDNDGDLFNYINIDIMLANISLYWFSGCIGASFWPYFVRHRSPDWPISLDRPIEVPTGYSEFPKEIFSPPKSLASQYYNNIIFWKTHQSGGHFAAMENPKTLVSDINSFVKKV